MSVIVEKPYRFVPPVRTTLWPAFVQRFRLFDLYLKYKEGVVSYECRHVDRLKQSIAAGHGVLIAPNHCRYADPLVLGWLSREMERHVYAMASWHLFNKSWFDRFSIPKVGGFSIFREGVDRQSLETAIQAMVEARRPLIVFPEGTTNRTNDHLQPLLEGVMFMARTAAKRREKAGAGPVVIHPVGIKYVFRGEIEPWADAALGVLEERLSWQRRSDLPILPRIERVANGLLSLKEVQYLGRVGAGTLSQRCDGLIQHLLASVETEFFGKVDGAHPLTRVRVCRAKLLQHLVDPSTAPALKPRLRRKIRAVDLAQQLVSYPPDYFNADQLTDTRILETLERMQEDFIGRPTSPKPLHAVIEVDHPIVVSGERAPRGQTDPLLCELDARLRTLLARLSGEANPYNDASWSSESAKLASSIRDSDAEATDSAITESRMLLNL